MLKSHLRRKGELQVIAGSLHVLAQKYLGESTVVHNSAQNAPLWVLSPSSPPASLGGASAGTRAGGGVA